MIVIADFILIFQEGEHVKVANFLLYRYNRVIPEVYWYLSLIFRNPEPFDHAEILLFFYLKWRLENYSIGWYFQQILHDMVGFMHKSWKYLSIQCHVVHVNPWIANLVTFTFCDFRFFRFLLKINSRQLKYVLRSQPFRNIRLFWNLLNHLFRILQNYLIQKSDISTCFALKSLFPINKPHIVVELPSVLLHFLYFQLVRIFLVDPFRQQALILHQLLLQAQLYVNQHVGSGFELYQFFLCPHFLCIKVNRLMVPTKVILQDFVLWH